MSNIAFAFSWEQVFDVWLHAFSADQPSGKDEAGTNILQFQVRIGVEDGLCRITRGKHAKDVLNRNKK